MTILNNFLIFNKTVEIKTCSYCDGTGKTKCSSCNGTGKTKSNKMTGGTTIFCAVVGTACIISFLDMIGSTPNYLLSVPMFVVSTIVGILILAEHKQQTVCGK